MTTGLVILEQASTLLIIQSFRKRDQNPSLTTSNLMLGAMRNAKSATFKDVSRAILITDTRLKNIS